MTIRTDTVIIGAGPVGLFQVFELGLLGLEAHLIDSLPQPGGQCTELYPDKPIYDIPALPVCGAQELIDRLQEQIKPFNPTFHLGQTATEIEKRDDGRFTVVTSKGTTFDTGVVIIAAGAGSFEPKRMSVRGARAYENTTLFYRVKDKTKHAGKHLVILGGGDSALDWTLELVKEAASVTLVHRSQKFRAAPASVAQMRALCDDFQMQFIEGTVQKFEGEDGIVKELHIRGKDLRTRRLECDHVLCFWGLSPKLGPIADWGLDLHKRTIKVDTEKFQTSVEGIYAIGDINYYPGKKRLILSGFHEAALAAFAIKAHLNPGEKVFLQYTTTSPKMHERLGVESPYKEDEM